MIDFNDANFGKEVLKAKRPVLVDFWAAWCSPCLMAGSVIEKLAKEYQGKIKVGKVNVDENPKISQKYEVMSIPTVVVFNNGKETKRLVGFPGKSGYQNLIKEIIK